MIRRKTKILLFLQLITIFIISCNNKDKYIVVNKVPLIQCEILDNKEIKVFHSDYIIKTEEAIKYNSQASDLARKGQFIESKEMLEKALEIDVNNPVLLNNVGLIEIYLNDYDKASRYFNQSLIYSDSLYFPSAQNLAHLYMNNDEYDKSEKLLNSIIKKSQIDFVKGFMYLELSAIQRNFSNNTSAKFSILNAKYYLEKYKIFDNSIENIEESLKQKKVTKGLFDDDPTIFGDPVPINSVVK